MNWRRLDFINQVDGWLAGVRYGKMHRFSCEYNNGWTCLEVTRLLNGYGVRVWGREMYQENDEFAFLVKEKQARWAQAVMVNRGITINEGEIPGMKKDGLHATLPSFYKSWGVGTKKSGVDMLVDAVVKAVGL